MWQLLKKLYITCLFLIGYMPKKKVLPISINAIDNVPKVTDISQPIWIHKMQKELLAAKAEAEKPIISEEELEKLVNNFLNKILPEEYKKYLKDPSTNIGGEWIIITHYAFKNDTRLVKLALPIVTKKLQLFNIRVSDRGQNGYMWINAPDITKSLEPIEHKDRKWLNKTIYYV